jgi:hypothetical protein
MSKVRAAALLVMFSFACGKKDGGEPKKEPPPTAADAAPAAKPVDAAAAAAIADAATAAAPVDAGAGPATGPDAGKVAGDPNQGPPRDLKVLPKSWSREKVEKWMEDNIERGLGVKCEFCHDEKDYAADHEHKDIARAMMRMTSELDRTYFKGKGRVTCFTCHLGKEEPPGSK